MTGRFEHFNARPDGSYLLILAYADASVPQRDRLRDQAGTLVYLFTPIPVPNRRDRWARALSRYVGIIDACGFPHLEPVGST
jgi:hypothetical protein